jgi:hypothetical protein
MRVVAAKLSDEDAVVLQQCKARAAEAVEYCLAMKADAGSRWNPANLEAALHFQRMLEQLVWEVDDVHRLCDAFVTGQFHENVVQWSLRHTVEHFVILVNRAARGGGSTSTASGS